MTAPAHGGIQLVQVDSDAARICVREGEVGSPVLVELVDGKDRELPDHLDVRREGDRLVVQVRTVREQRWRRGRSLEARLRISAAPDVALDVRTDAGALKVDGRSAPVTARASAGAVKVDRIVGALDVQTVAGAVKVSDSHGDARISTDAGAIRLERHHADAIDLRTSAGAVKATELHVDRARVATEVGGAKLEFERAPTDVDVRCAVGAIDVAVPEDRYRIDQETGFLGRAVVEGLSSDPAATRTIRVASTGLGASRIRSATTP
jgi:hypothetical protein